MRLLVVTAQKLRTRVLDSGLRAAIGEFINVCTQDSTDLKNRQPDDAIRELHHRDHQLAVGYTHLAEQLGEHLRAELDRRILVNEIDKPSSGSV